MVGCGDDRADTPYLSACLAQPFKRLGAGDFMHQMAVNVQNGGTVFFGVHNVLVPDFVVEGFGHGMSFVKDGLLV